MKYRRKVFEMNDAELECVAQNLALPCAAPSAAHRPTRTELQEEIVQWLMSEGLGIRHNFLLFEDDQSSPSTHSVAVNGSTVAEGDVDKAFRRRSIYLLKQMHECDCCHHVRTSRPAAAGGSAGSGSGSADGSAQPSSSSNARLKSVDPPQKYVPSMDPLREASYIPQQQQLSRPNSLSTSPRKQQQQELYHQQRNNNKARAYGNSVIQTQPTRSFDSRRVYGNGLPQKHRKHKDESLQFDCCCCKSYFVECGRFCVEILRGT